MEIVKSKDNYNKNPDVLIATYINIQQKIAKSQRKRKRLENAINVTKQNTQ